MQKKTTWGPVLFAWLNFFFPLFLWKSGEGLLQTVCYCIPTISTCRYYFSFDLLHSSVFSLFFSACPQTEMQGCFKTVMSLFYFIGRCFLCSTDAHSMHIRCTDFLTNACTNFCHEERSCTSMITSHTLLQWPSARNDIAVWKVLPDYWQEISNDGSS